MGWRTGQRDEPINPRSAKDAHGFLRELVDQALKEKRSAFLVTLKPLEDGAVDVRSGMMNLDCLEKGLLMMAFALVQMNRHAKTDIKDDLRTLGEFVGELLQ